MNAINRGSAMGALRLLAGSLVVYFAVAIDYGCSGAPPGSASSGGHAGASATSTGSTGTSSGSGPVPNANADESGSRLKAQSIVGADGSVHYLGLYDSQLKVTCSFEAMSDNNLHCIPASTTVGVINSYFADSACSQPITWIATGCTPSYATKPVSAPGCAASVTHVFSVGAAFTGTPFVNTGTCNALPTTLQGYDAYMVGSEIAPSTFVSGTLTTAP